MTRISIFGSQYQDSHLAGLQYLLEQLENKGFEVAVEENFAKYLRRSGIRTGSARDASLFPEDTECVLSIGGDGTFLHAARWIGKSETPIMGINTGHLGFLAGYSLAETDELLDVLATGRGVEERRAVVEVSCDALPQDFWPYALNEVAVLKGDTASMVTVHADIDGLYLADYQSDGLVVATPTGSTAYNLSVGGPIMQPTLKCLVISPIAPHSLTMRPLVVSGDSRVMLRASSRVGDCRVSLDGRSFLMPCGEPLLIKEADFRVVVLRRPDTNYPEILRSKLLWGK